MFSKFNKRLFFIFFICLCCIVFLYKVKSILAPFIFGLLIAYICKNTVEKYEKKFSRQTLSLVIISLISLFFIFILIFVAPIVVKQIMEITKQLSIFAKEFNVDVFYNKHIKILNIMNINSPQEVSSLLNGLYNLFTKYFADIANIFISSSWKIVNTSFMFFITPIIAFYFLRDWKIMNKNIMRLIPKEYKNNYNILKMRIDDILHNYIIGQINVTIIISIFYTTLLLFIGFEYSFIVGITAGILTLLPYIGAFGGCFIGLCLSFFQYGYNLTKILEIIAIFSCGQFLEGNFITPSLIGNRIKVHPLWLMFAMFAGASLKGFWGIVISMPISAIIGVVYRFSQEIKIQNNRQILFNKQGKINDNR